MYLISYHLILIDLKKLIFFIEFSIILKKKKCNLNVSFKDFIKILIEVLSNRNNFAINQVLKYEFTTSA